MQAKANQKCLFISFNNCGIYRIFTAIWRSVDDMATVMEEEEKVKDRATAADPPRTPIPILKVSTLFFITFTDGMSYSEDIWLLGLSESKFLRTSVVKLCESGPVYSPCISQMLLKGSKILFNCIILVIFEVF
jgi:hypothetical protein